MVVRGTRDSFCHYCGKRTGPMTWDHVVPLSVGGSNKQYNRVTACPECNNKKADHLPDYNHCAKCGLALMLYHREVGMLNFRYRLPAD